MDGFSRLYLSWEKDEIRTLKIIEEGRAGTSAQRKRGEIFGMALM
jgi:hypothetical protein